MNDEEFLGMLDAMPCWRDNPWYDDFGYGAGLEGNPYLTSNPEWKECGKMPKPDESNLEHLRAVNTAVSCLWEVDADSPRGEHARGLAVKTLLYALSPVIESHVAKAGRHLVRTEGGDLFNETLAKVWEKFPEVTFPWTDGEPHPDSEMVEEPPYSWFCAGLLGELRMCLFEPRGIVRRIVNKLAKRLTRQRRGFRCTAFLDFDRPPIEPRPPRNPDEPDTSKEPSKNAQEFVCGTHDPNQSLRSRTAAGRVPRTHRNGRSSIRQ